MYLEDWNTKEVVAGERAMRRRPEKEGTDTKQPRFLFLFSSRFLSVSFTVFTLRAILFMRLALSVFLIFSVVTHYTPFS